MTPTSSASGVLVGTTANGITTPWAAGTPSVRAAQTPRASHFFAYLRTTYGSYREAIRHLPDVRRILEWIEVAMSGGYERHRLPPERVFHVLADSPDPSIETVQQALSALRLHPSAHEVRKYLKASRMVAARVNRWLDNHPGWDHYGASPEDSGYLDGLAAQAASLPGATGGPLNV